MTRYKCCFNQKNHHSSLPLLQTRHSQTRNKLETLSCCLSIQLPRSGTKEVAPHSFPRPWSGEDAGGLYLMLHPSQGLSRVEKPLLPMPPPSPWSGKGMGGEGGSIQAECLYAPSPRNISIGGNISEISTGRNECLFMP